MIVFCQNCNTEPLELRDDDSRMLMSYYRPVCLWCLRDRGHAFAIWCESQERAMPELRRQGRQV